MPAPRGRSRRAAAGADHRLLVRQLRRRRDAGARGRRLARAKGEQIRLMATGRGLQRRAARRVHAQVGARARRSRPARWASSSPASRSCRRAKVGDTRHAREEAADTGRPRAAAGLQGNPAAGVRRPVSRSRPSDTTQLRDALEKLKLNDSSLRYEPEVSPGAGLRLPLRLPRPAAHGDRAGAAGARVRPWT